MRYLRFLVPAAALSFAFGFILPEFKVTVPGGVVGFLLTIGLGAGFGLIYNGYKFVEPRLVRRFSGNKLRPEHVFYLGLLGMSILSSLILVGVAQFTGLLTVAGVFAAGIAGLSLTMIGTALVPSPALSSSNATEPKPEPQPEPAPVTEPAPVATEPTPAVQTPAVDAPVVADKPVQKTDDTDANAQVVDTPVAVVPPTDAPPSA